LYVLYFAGFEEEIFDSVYGGKQNRSRNIGSVKTIAPLYIESMHRYS